MTRIDKNLVTGINESLEISLPDITSYEDLHKKLSDHINFLINQDFEKLVFYLYRIDVDESKMRRLLEEKEGENAPGLIATLIIERQLEKMKSRKQFRQRDDNIDENEKW